MKTRRIALATLLALGTLSGVALAQAPAAPVSPPPLPKDVPAFEVAQYNSFTWYGRFGYTNCAFIDMGDGVLVIDTGWTKQDAENLKAQIAEKTKGKPVRWIVMTQTDVDSNGGIEAFLPTDATIFLHARALEPLSRTVFAAVPGRKNPTVVGVEGRLGVYGAGRRLELVAAPDRAHSGFDLVAYCNDNALAFVGDLVTTGRCPNLLNPVSDPAGWLGMLEKIRALNPAGFLGTRGEPTKAVSHELEQTQVYIERVVGLLAQEKAKNSPEARVAAELSLRKVGEYCPTQGDNANILGLYRRMQPDGTFSIPSPAAPVPTSAPAPRGTPAPGGAPAPR